MATTDQKSGFRLPWASDRGEADAPGSNEPDQAADAWPSADQAADRPAVGDGAPSSQATAAPRKPSKFLADLTRAMQAAAEQAREQTLTQFQADSKAYVEQIHETSANDAATIRTNADADIAAIREWSKAEMARIREETERRIGSRRTELDHQLEAHAASIESRIERVHATVTEFEAEMAAFFERLLDEDDPSAFASMAENLPEPPGFEVVMPGSFDPPPTLHVVAPEPVRISPTEPVEAAPVPVAVDEQPTATESPAWPASDVAPGGESSDQGDAPAEASDAAAVDLDAAEAEAALAARAESLPEEHGTDDERASFVDRLSGVMAGGHVEQDVADSVATQVVVVGLVSVASIASFKRHLTRVDGVEAVGVTSGPDGEFVFTVSHRSTLDIGAVVTTLPGFGAQVAGSGNGVLNIVAHDPDADA